MPTKIQWADESWNPVIGCTKCSPGCKHCYAERMAYRLYCMGNPKYESVVNGVTTSTRHRSGWSGKIYCDESALDEPLHWRKPRRIFVCSMSDLFHEKVPFEFIHSVFAVAALCPQHTLLMLTKQPKAMLKYISKKHRWRDDILPEVDKLHSPIQSPCQYWWPLSNVWLGVSVCNQQEADEKIPILLQIPAAKRFVSLEPLLGEINLASVRAEPDGNGKGWRGQEGGYPYLNCLTGREYTVLVGQDTDYKLDWVIVGGESGPGARPMQPDWARSIRDQCKAADVPFFFKQWGRWKPGRSEWNGDTGLNTGRWIEIDGSYSPWHQKRTRGPQWINPDGSIAYKSPHPYAVFMTPVGKKKAGNALDGKIYEEYPK